MFGQTAQKVKPGDKISGSLSQVASKKFHGCVTSDIGKRSVISKLATRLSARPGARVKCEEHQLILDTVDQRFFNPSC